MLGQIDFFPFMFNLVFILVFAIIILTVAINFYRFLRRPTETRPENSATIIKEREVIKEIIKIRCPYCNNLYDEKYDVSSLRRQKRTLTH